MLTSTLGILAYLKCEKASRNAKKQEETLKSLKDKDISKYLMKWKQEKLQHFLAKATSAEKDREEAAENFFSVYVNTFSIEAHAVWEKIVSKQIGTASWTDLKGYNCTLLQMYCPPSANSL